MNNFPAVILVDPNTIVKSRIRAILANYNVRIYEALNRHEIQSILSKNNYNVALIITEIEISAKNNFDGISLINFIKNKSSSIPIVVLTAICKKDVITRCLHEGVAEYILKPFQDESLKEKLLKYVNLESLNEVTVLKFNLNNFLTSEIHKAKKGNYFFSLLKVTFNTSEDELNSQDSGYYKYAEFIYKEISTLFWDSDLYIQHGFQSHLGFFPFCNQENTRIIIKKISAKFYEFRMAEPNLSNYSITHSFSTYPIDGTTASELLKALASQERT